MDRWLERYATTKFRRGLEFAHDIKAPLNVAALHLALLRIHLDKRIPDDSKAAMLLSRAEAELRRSAMIVDRFFVVSTPPQDLGDPSAIEIGSLIAAEAARFGISYVTLGQTSIVAHEATIRELGSTLFEGLTRTLKGVQVHELESESEFVLEINGDLTTKRDDPATLTRFDCTDAEGNPELGLPTAALLAEILGGVLEVECVGLRFTSRLRIPADRS